MSRVFPLTRHTGWKAAFFLHLGLILIVCTLYMIAVNINFSAFGFVGMLTGENVVLTWNGGYWPQLAIAGGWADAINFLRIAGVMVSIIQAFFWITPSRGSLQEHRDTAMPIEVPPALEWFAVGAMLYDVISTWWALSNGQLLAVAHYGLFGAILRAAGILLFTIGMLSFGAELLFALGADMVVLHWSEGWELTGIFIGEVLGGVAGALIAGVRWCGEQLDNMRGINRQGGGQPRDDGAQVGANGGYGNTGHGNTPRPRERDGRSLGRTAPLSAPIAAPRGAALPPDHRPIGPARGIQPPAVGQDHSQRLGAPQFIGDEDD